MPEKCRAIKEIRKGTQSAPLPVDYRRELLALGRLSKREDLFVRFLGWYEDNRTVYLAMEYFEQGDLGRHLSAPLAEDEVRVISKQLLEGLAVLHSQNWAHRDLKPPNIFVVDTSSWWVKIGDFGISKRIRSGNTRFQTMIGTLDFVAPEVLNLVSEVDDEDTGDEEDEYTVAVDMWSLGCVVYQLLTSEIPFANRRKLGSYCRSKLEKFPLGPLERAAVSVAATEVIRGWLEPIPSHRTTADAALRCEWIQGVPSSSDNVYVSQEQLKLTSSSDDGSSHRRIKASSPSNSHKPKFDGGSIELPSTSVHSLEEQTGDPALVRGFEKSSTTEQRPDPRNPASIEHQTSFNVGTPRVPASDLDGPALRMAEQAAWQKGVQEANEPLYPVFGLEKPHMLYDSLQVEQARTGSTPRVPPVPLENVPGDGQRKYQPPQSTRARKALLVHFLPSVIEKQHVPQELWRNSACMKATADYLVGALLYQSEDVVCLDKELFTYEPTRKLTNAITWLVEAAQPGDSMFLHLLGECASTLPYISGCLQPFLLYPNIDSGLVHLGSARHDELLKLLAHPIPKGARLTVILDAALFHTPLSLEYVYETTWSSNSADQERRSRATRSIQSTMPLSIKGANFIQSSEGDILLWYYRSRQ